MEKLTLNVLCIMFNGLMDLMPSPSQIVGLTPHPFTIRLENHDWLDFDGPNSIFFNNVF
jgi:hypothetical protein